MNVYLHLVLNCGWSLDKVVALRKEEEREEEERRKKELSDHLASVIERQKKDNSITKLEEFDF